MVKVSIHHQRDFVCSYCIVSYNNILHPKVTVGKLFKDALEMLVLESGSPIYRPLPLSATVDVEIQDTVRVYVVSRKELGR